MMVARKVAEAVEGNKRDVNLSMRSKIACHINYWFPTLIDYILKRKAMSGFEPKGD